jgi:hypothetical protein
VTSPEILSYIAGFLDGDGCINLQIVRRKDYKLGYQIRPSVTFFQSTINRFLLEWLKSTLGVGFIRDRKDGVSEYAIVEVDSVLKVLSQLRPYIRLKMKQCDLTISVAQELSRSKRLEPRDFLELARKVDQFIDLDFSRKRSIRSDQVEGYLRAQQLLIP